MYSVKYFSKLIFSFLDIVKLFVDFVFVSSHMKKNETVKFS